MAATTRTLLALGGAALVALAVTGCGSADASDAPVEKKSFAFSGKALTISADNSLLTLVPADVKQIEVERQVDGWVMFGSGPDPVWELTGDTLKLKVECTGISAECSARHSVKIPRGTAVTVDNDNGRVEATGFTTDLKVKSDNGEIDLKNMSGKLDLESDNGWISGADISAKNVTAKSDNGEVKLAFTAVPDLVDGRSNNGAVRLTLPKAAYQVDARSNNGHVRADVEKADNSTHVVKARSDNGEVTLQSAN
ncbi:hypothetical protein GCM10010329_15400 [Streptomyces spiroverticillatus]|uniref:DUF4097 domain-containing protein n=1 Tax=Streptomyces finlayi TaxID=67296 RepID=A0A919CCX2_9ACTN|nr:DUF4097 family beta strand repeat-containing protein [Streptomyces finlayi]GGZ94829.1 hypothetical protein GCM10010329_15400 [Streptomyces spiroverticillatus]GHD07162.1 hypothetical protein GCM10010334_59430 [Streptomyces finlayi]